MIKKLLLLSLALFIFISTNIFAGPFDNISTDKPEWQQLLEPLNTSFFGVSLKQNTTVNQDIYFNTVDFLDLKGYTLYVNGNANIQGVSIDINDGDFRIFANNSSSGNLNHSDGDITFNGGQLILYSNYTESNKGSLYINNSDDLFSINGAFEIKDFLVNEITAGTISIKRDLIFSNTKNFICSGTNKIILTGDTVQTIKLNSSNVTLNDLEIQNPVEVKVEGLKPLKVNKLILTKSSTKINLDDFEYNEIVTLVETGKFNLKQGWNMIAFPSTKTVKFDDYFKNIPSLWIFSNGNWGVWSSNISSVSNLGFSLASEVSPGQGIWVYANSDSEITYEKNSTSYSILELNIALENGWNFLGTGENLTVNDFINTYPTVKAVFKWNASTQSWEGSSTSAELKQIIQDSGITPFSTIYAGEGFWAYTGN